MPDPRLIRLSKLMSLILRHKPEDFGVVLDAEGYAPIDEIVRAVASRMPDASEEDLMRVVETIEPDKRRFSVSERDIRANYGHSIAERIVQSPAVPPAMLLHGTSERAVDNILSGGIRPMRRQYVHLTTSADLAARIGLRHGSVCVLTVDASRAHEAGIAFYRANEAFWLADHVPAEFVRRT
jgi:putative RNA 2'-phosphotransferase